MSTAVFLVLTLPRVGVLLCLCYALSKLGRDQAEDHARRWRELNERRARLGLPPVGPE